MSAPVAGSATSADDLELLARLRRGDEAAFTQLVERLHGPMLRVAMAHVGNRAVAEEVAQDAWVGVLAQLDRFEGRSSLRTWVLRIVANRARTRAVRKRRTLPFSSLNGLEEEGRG
jgi:RNA polymerase sigma-70 factor, ECF subfamily